MAGYVRQSAAQIITDNIVMAADLNAEFNALASAFNAASGHAHDGSAGNGPKISLTTSVAGILPVENGGTGDPDLISNLQEDIDSKLPKAGGEITGDIIRKITDGDQEVDLLSGVVVTGNISEDDVNYVASISRLVSGDDSHVVVGSSGFKFSPYSAASKPENSILTYGPDQRVYVGNATQPNDAVNLITFNSQLSSRSEVPSSTSLPLEGRKYVLTNSRSGTTFSPSFTLISTPSDTPTGGSLAVYGSSGTLRANNASAATDVVNLGQADARYLKLSGGSLSGGLSAVGTLTALPASSGNSHLVLADSAGENRALVYWNGSSDTLRVRKYDGAGSYSEVFWSGNDGRMRGLRTPVNTDEPATKNYVDSSTNITKSYVDTSINTATSGSMSGRAYPRASSGHALDFVWAGQTSQPKYVLGAASDAREVHPYTLESVIRGLQPSLGFTPIQQGGGTGQGTNKIHIGWGGSGVLLLQVDNVNFSNTWPINISGSANVSNAQVMNQIAALSPGTVGTFAFAIIATNSERLQGETIAGSELRWAAGGSTSGTGDNLFGTWRCLGRAATNDNKATLWVRIS